MSREENTRHVMEATAQLASRSFAGRFRSPQNRLRFLVGFWLLLVCLYIGFYKAFQNGDRTDATPRQPPAGEGRFSSRFPTVSLFFGVVGLSIGGSLAVFFWKQKQASRAYAQGLRARDSSTLLRAVDGLFPPHTPMPDVEVYRVQARAVAHVLFGEVDLARRELSQVKWEGRPPIVRALEHNVESLIHMLCTGEPAHGLALARETAAMAELPSSWPGAKTARAFHEMCIGMGECLTGEATPATVQALEHYHQSATLPLSRLLSAHGLRAAYQRAGDTARAGSMRQLIQQMAPHCRPFQQLPS